MPSKIPTSHKIVKRSFRVLGQSCLLFSKAQITRSFLEENTFVILYVDIVLLIKINMVSKKRIAELFTFFVLLPVLDIIRNITDCANNCAYSKGEWYSTKRNRKPIKRIVINIFSCEIFFDIFHCFTFRCLEPSKVISMTLLLISYIIIYTYPFIKV